MKKYNYVGWCMAGSLGLSAMSGQAAQPEKKQPHIILIMTDQQRWDALGCAGNEAVISPNVDRLAADGHLFCNAYTAAPSSTPARAGMLTGMCRTVDRTVSLASWLVRIWTGGRALSL